MKRCVAIKGGDLPFAALTTNDSNAQGATFAKFERFPESGLSCNMQRMPGESPLGPMLRNARMSAIMRKPKNFSDCMVLKRLFVVSEETGCVVLKNGVFYLLNS